MTPGDLRRAHGEAVPTCLAALGEPAAHGYGCFANPEPVPAPEIVAIYRRRARHVEYRGLPTLGFHEAVQQLAATAHPTVRLAGVEGLGGYPKCVVFLAPAGLDVIAALAVLGPAPPT